MRKLNGKIHRHQALVFWHTEAQQLNDFRKVLYYQDLREEAYQAIDELCNIPQYDDSDNNFDTSDSSEKD